MNAVRLNGKPSRAPAVAEDVDRKRQETEEDQNRPKRDHRLRSGMSRDVEGQVADHG